MQIGNLNLSYGKREYETVIVDEEIKKPTEFLAETSEADSPYYSKYQLRPYNPAELYQRRGDYSIYDDMLEDDQISAVLALKKLITLNSDWIIDCDDEEVVEFLEWSLTESLDDIFLKKVYQIMSAWDYGFSCTEIIADIMEYDGQQRICISALKTRAPHSFIFEQDSKGNLTNIKQSTAKGGYLDLNPDKFILYSYQMKFDNVYGESELNKGVYRAWWSKEAIIKFWNIYLERFGSPTPVVTMPRSGGNQEKARIKDILKNWQAKTGIILPEDFKIELLNVAAGEGGAGFEKAIDKYNTMIARRMLMPDLMGMSGSQTSGGSYALGEKQFDIFMTVIEYLRQDIERLINKHIISKLVGWNYGKGVEAKFKFNPIDKAKNIENLKMWLEAVKTGKIPVTQSQVDWFLEQVEAPEISDEEFAEMEAEKQAMQEAINGGQNGQPGNKNDTSNDGGSNGTNKAANKQPPADDNANKQNTSGSNSGDTKPGNKKYEFKPARELTSYEKRIDFEKIDNTFNELEEKYIKELAGAFTLGINGLIDDIKKRNIITKQKIEGIGKLEFRGRKKVQQVLMSLYKEVSGFAKEGIKKEYANTPTGLNNDDIAAWFEEMAFTISGIESDKILNEVKMIILEAVKSGAGVDETVRNISRALEGYSIAFPATVETIVRTNLSTAFNEARAQELEALGDEVQGYFYSAILDGRTSEICRRLDSGNNTDEKGNPKIYRAGELRNITPPNHFNCRSILVPVLIDEKVDNWGDVDSKLKESPKYPGFKIIDKEA